MTKIKLSANQEKFLIELSKLIKDHRATIRQFEGEFIVEFENEDDVWLEIYQIDSDFDYNNLK